MTGVTEASGETIAVQRTPPASDLRGAEPALERPGMGRHLALFAVVIALIGLDLWSKSAVFSWLEAPDAGQQVGYSERGHVRYQIIDGWEGLGFMLNLNYGAAFGKAAGAPWLLVGGRCLAALFLTWLIVRTPKGQKVYLSALVLILSGALGNLYDNFFYVPDPTFPGVIPDRKFGPVRDFIDVYFYGWDWHFPTFNVADSCITVGAVLLLLSGFFGAKAPVKEPATEASPPTA
ncbi:Lipoprotein signal peptidase [Planctomycetes bacterium Poly30]|uniref:Lipoprotein signal peptidase n=1 Tax=Saltatorellus ferox TaxID=2528018 RepID=A0A518ESK8_9BACT|nr:Lipoprotein signal peptidase [Planctomycetes bacterium Poly30]